MNGLFLLLIPVLSIAATEDLFLCRHRKNTAFLFWKLQNSPKE